MGETWEVRQEGEPQGGEGPCHAGKAVAGSRVEGAVQGWGQAADMETVGICKGSGGLKRDMWGEKLDFGT